MKIFFDSINLVKKTIAGGNMTSKRLMMGLFLIILGVFIMLERLGLIEARLLSLLWPILLIILGAAILLKKKE